MIFLNVTSPTEVLSLVLRKNKRNDTFPTKYLSGKDCGNYGPGKADATLRERKKTVISALSPKDYKYLTKSEL